MTKLRIFLADDHAVIREGLKALVNAQPDMEVIGEAADGRTAWEKAKDCQPDIVIMDLSMGHVPIFPVSFPAAQGVKSPYVSTCSTGQPCSMTATGVWPRHWHDTKRGSALSSAG